MLIFCDDMLLLFKYLLMEEEKFSFCGNTMLVEASSEGGYKQKCQNSQTISEIANGYFQLNFLTNLPFSMDV